MIAHQNSRLQISPGGICVLQPFKETCEKMLQFVNACNLLRSD